MSDLLSKVLDAHGGLARWNRFEFVKARIVTGGGLWALKGLVQDPAPREMTVSLHEQFASVTPFGQPGWRTNFRPARVAIEWTYLTTPFFMAMPEFEVSEIEPWVETGEQWRGLRARFPDEIASHSKEQDFYFGEDGLLRRHDYHVDVAGGFPAAQYVHDFVEAQGLRLPTRQRAFARGLDLRPVRDLLMVSIDLGDVEFTEAQTRAVRNPLAMQPGRSSSPNPKDKP